MRFCRLSVAVATICSCRSQRPGASAAFLSRAKRFGDVAFLSAEKEPCGAAVNLPLNMKASSVSLSRPHVALFSAVSGSNNADSVPYRERDEVLSGRNTGDLRFLGVCGAIGSGKSLACRILVSDLGCAAHIDADKLAHAVYNPGSSALEQIAEEFGTAVLQSDGKIDRKVLGSIVFADSNAMSKLERIVWPHVRSLLENRLKEIAIEKMRSRDVSDVNQTVVVVVEAAMLLDAGWDDLFDAVWVVTASRTTATDRLVSERGMDGEDASVRINAQESRRGIGNLEQEVKAGSVTAVIENDGSIEDLACALAEKLSNPLAWKDKMLAVSNLIENAGK